MQAPVLVWPGICVCICVCADFSLFPWMQVPSVPLVPFPLLIPRFFCYHFHVPSTSLTATSYNIIYNVRGSAVTSFSTVSSVGVDLRLCTFTQKGRSLAPAK